MKKLTAMMVSAAAALGAGVAGAQTWTLPTMAGNWKGETLSGSDRGVIRMTVLPSAKKGGVIARGESIWPNATCRWEIVAAGATATTINGDIRVTSGGCNNTAVAQITLTTKANGKALLNMSSYVPQGGVMPTTPNVVSTFYRY